MAFIPNLLSNFTTTTITTDGNKTSFKLNRNPSNNKTGTFTVTGTFNGATVKLQTSYDGATWFDVSGASLTSAGQLTVDGLMSYMRCVVSGSGASTSLDVNFQ